MTRPRRPDRNKLYELASQQAGYFSARQARESGFSGQLVSWHVHAGNFLRVRRGLYRLQRYPVSPQDHIIEAWLAAGPLAVVSHESALNLHGLSDVVPSAVHLVVPRSHRWVAGRVPPGVALHTTVRPLPSNAVTTVGAIRVTMPARSIVDAADAGTAPDQILVAIREALNQGLTTPRELRTVSGNRSARVRELVDRGIREAKAA